MKENRILVSVWESVYLNMVNCGLPINVCVYLQEISAVRHCQKES